MAVNLSLVLMISALAISKCSSVADKFNEDEGGETFSCSKHCSCNGGPVYLNCTNICCNVTAVPTTSKITISKSYKDNISFSTNSTTIGVTAPPSAKLEIEVLCVIAVVVVISFLLVVLQGESNNLECNDSSNLICFT